MRLRSAAGTLALVGILLATSLPARAAWPDQYSDVNSWPPWAAHSVVTPNDVRVYTGGDLEEAVWWELFVGDPPASGNPSDPRPFRPNDTITRAEFATILSRALGTGASDGSGATWYTPHVAALAGDSILSDGGDWAEPISRREMGQWIGRALRWYGAPENATATEFPDIAFLPEREDIGRAARSGVIKGYEDGTYRPERTASRTEAAAMIVRCARLLRKHPPTAGELLAVLKESDGLVSQAYRDLAAKKTLDLSPLEPYATWLGLYGPGGLKSSMLEVYDARPEFGWQVFSDYQFTPILLRDTIALVHVTFVSHAFHRNGEPFIGTYPYDEYEYLVKQDGRWRRSNAKDPNEYGPGKVPQPEP